MITPESTDTALDASQSTRSWVWHSTDDSIAAGQISVLSVVETFCALGLYGWLAFHFEHQWWLLISAVAAPIILLRSPESKEHGLSLMRQYWGNNEGSIIDHSKNRQYINEWEALFIRATLLITILLMLHIIYSDINGIIQFPARILFYIIFMLPTLVLLFSPSSAVLNFKSFDTYQFFTVLFGFFSLSVSSISILLIAIPHTLTAVNIKQARGIFLRCLFIRILSVFYHLTNGLINLPRNWRENLFAIDLTHFPELIPDAKKISNELYSKHIFNELISNKGFYNKFHSGLIFISN